MNDLLDLLARSFGHELTGVIQPRLPARFEATAIGPRETDLETGAASLAVATPPARERPNQSPDIVTLSSPALDTSETVRISSGIALATDRQDEPAPHNLAAPTPLTGQTGAQPATTPTVTQPMVVWPTPPVLTVQATPNLTPPKPALAAEQTVLTEADAPISIQSSRTILATTSAAATPTAPALTLPHLTLAATPDSTPSSQRETRPLPPSRMTITIGRIEIRAIPPTAPPARSRPSLPKPALSLDDYLRRREGGKR